MFVPKVQFASDYDGDLHLFPADLDERDYENRWRVWVLHTDGSRREVQVSRPVMCVVDGVVKNPLWDAETSQVAGWNVDDMNSSAIEISIDSKPPKRIRHPRP